MMNLEDNITLNMEDNIFFIAKKQKQLETLNYGLAELLSKANLHQTIT